MRNLVTLPWWKCVWLLSWLCCLVVPVSAQTAQLRLAKWARMPAVVDSNSPGFWRDGRFNVVNSTGVPLVSAGVDQFQWDGSSTQPVQVDLLDHFAMWIEAVWQDSDGSIYAWYHNEPGGLCPNSSLTAPQIGALVSYDGGKSFADLGIILSSGDPIDCSAQNGFFAGGHGDFSVILDRGQRHFYFLFGNYGGSLPGQGVAMARLAFEDRGHPAGAVAKYYQGEWTEPGLGGQVTPVFPAAAAWQQEKTDAFWGPSIHWNHYLESYVVLMNHACCRPRWPQEGIYISYNADLSNPAGWKRPERILRGQDIWFGANYYPQVLGVKWDETDTIAGQVARLYVKGISMWEIFFSR